MDTHKGESRRKWYAACYPGKQTNRSHTVLLHSAEMEGYVVHHNIFRFDIAMDDSLRMYFIDSLTDLLHYRGNLSLYDGLATSKLLI